MFQHTATRRWLLRNSIEGTLVQWFQHTATRRWLLKLEAETAKFTEVSTHSHPKVAAFDPRNEKQPRSVSTHSHPKVAAQWRCVECLGKRVSTHSHPKVAAGTYGSTHKCHLLFQHTATRRWLLARSMTNGWRWQSFNTQPPEGGCW